MQPERAKKNSAVDPCKLLAFAKAVASDLAVGKDLADEIAQKAVIAILNSRSEIINLQAYVRKVVHRIAYAELRKRQASEPIDGLDLPVADRAQSPSELAEISDLTNAIKHLLSPDDLLILTEHFVEERSYSSLAAERRVAESTLRLRVQQMLALLRSKVR